jgi:hypothetical protein
MQIPEKNALFTELTTEESTRVSGGTIITKITYKRETGTIEIETEDGKDLTLNLWQGYVGPWGGGLWGGYGGLWSGHGGLWGGYGS